MPGTGAAGTTGVTVPGSIAPWRLDRIVHL